MRHACLSLFAAASLMAPLAALADRTCPALLDHPFSALLGTKADRLCDFAGQVVLVVNTASECAYTPQYEGLDALHRRYADQGLAVVGFPSNDFGGQEPGSGPAIAEFCQTTYGVGFPLHQKTRVTGAQAHPLYRMLAERAGHAPGWNFHKYLIGRDGRSVMSFDSRVRPDDPVLISAIERLLAEGGAAATRARY